MSLFKKTSRTSFIRDPYTRNVTRVIKSGDKEKTTYWDRKAREREARKQERKEQRFDRKFERQEQRKKEREAFRQSRNEERIKVKREQGRRAARSSFFEPVLPRKIVYVKSSQRRGKQRGGKKKKGHKKRNRSPGDFQNEIMRRWGW